MAEISTFADSDLLGLGIASDILCFSGAIAFDSTSDDAIIPRFLGKGIEPCPMNLTQYGLCDLPTIPLQRLGSLS